MARRGIVRGALVGTLRGRRLWLVQFFANPLLAALFAVWLLIPVATKWYVVLNVFVALVIVILVIVLHGGTLNYFRDRDRDESSPLKSAFWRALRHVVAIAVCVGVFYLLWLLMDRVDAYSASLLASRGMVSCILVSAGCGGCGRGSGGPDNLRLDAEFRDIDVSIRDFQLGGARDLRLRTRAVGLDAGVLRGDARCERAR